MSSDQKHWWTLYVYLESFAHALIFYESGKCPPKACVLEVLLTIHLYAMDMVQPLRDGVYWVRLCLVRMFPIVVNETWVPSSFCFLIALERAASCVSCTGHGTRLLYRYKWTPTIEHGLKTKTICGISLIKVIHLQYLLQQRKTEGHHGFVVVVVVNWRLFSQEQNIGLCSYW